MLLVHQDQEFRDRGVSLSFGYNPTPLTPFGFMAKLTPSWGGQATSGAQALWGRETMAGMAAGGPAEGGAMHFDLGVYANRRESPSQGTAEHGVLGRLTARW